MSLPKAVHARLWDRFYYPLGARLYRHLAARLWVRLYDRLGTLP